MKQVKGKRQKAMDRQQAMGRQRIGNRDRLIFGVLPLLQSTQQDIIINFRFLNVRETIQKQTVTKSRLSGFSGCGKVFQNWNN